MQSLLYHGFGIKDVEYLKTSYEGGAIHIHVRTRKEKLCCSNCESKNVTKKGAINRTFRTVPIGLKAVYIVADVQRLECHECGMVRQESLTWADKKNLYP